MKTLRRYKLALEDYPYPAVRMPVSAEITGTAGIGDCLYIWALVDAEQPSYLRHFCLCNTGHRFDAEDWSFIGIVPVYGKHEDTLWHVFQKKP